MTLAQVQAAVAVVAVLIATWAGLLITVALLLPKQAGKAETTLETAPWRSFFGGLALFLGVIFGLILLRLPLPGAKLLGFFMTLGFSGMATIGAAGLARLMGRRIGELSGAKTSFGALVRGSIVLSMAIGFPYVGWFLFVPVMLVVSLGAGAASLWPDRQVAYPPVAPLTKPDYDVLPRQGAL